MTLARASDLHPELRAEPHVSLNDVVHVAHPVAQHERALDAQAEGEAGVAVGVDAARGEHAAVDHAAAAHLDPARATAGAAVRVLAVADPAAAVDLGARLGEREVRRAQPGDGALAEQRRDEGVEAALET